MEFEDIKGMGKARIEKLRAVGVVRPLDLLLRFPYKYVDLNIKADISELNGGDELTVYGVVAAEPTVKFLRKGLRMTTAVIETAYGILEAVWFNQKYIKSALTRGKTVYLNGKVKKFGNKISLSAPVLIKPSAGKSIIPLYRNIPGIPQNICSDAIDSILSCADIQGYIPENIREKYGMPSLNAAFRQVHRPDNIVCAQKAARALSLEKLSYILSMFSVVKSAAGYGNKHKYNAGESELALAVKSLPFELTCGQINALKDIINSLRGNSPMNRLLQGDVGCGKTIVALLAMYFAYLNGYQSVLMAPTEILAYQHYKSAIKLLEPLGVKTVLLCGSLTKNERDKALFNIRTKTADIIIGTHALIGDDVKFNNLALIVTDEQQRFGVSQRGRLENKALGADTLVMTATPIPRTLALCMYGELEQTAIKSLPVGRPDIITKTVPKNKHKAMLDYIASRSDSEQTYMVCPRIEATEEDELVSALDLFEELVSKYKNIKIGLLHGKLKDSEKTEIMNEFERGEIRILVSTTVIEVGIDVPEAVNIVIFNSQRYGLSQLHQLRGRVGRGKSLSYCFLPIDGAVPERLKYFCNCKNGFELAEYDFAQRGAGDFIGTRQHGETEEISVKVDAELISEAKSICEDMLSDAATLVKLKSAATGAEQYVLSVTMN